MTTSPQLRELPTVTIGILSEETETGNRLCSVGLAPSHSYEVSTMTNNRAALVPITELAPRLKALTGREGPRYRHLYMRALDDRLGAPVQRIYGRLFLHENDLPAIAAALGMTTTLPEARDAGRTTAEHATAEQAAA